MRELLLKSQRPPTQQQQVNQFIGLISRESGIDVDFNIDDLQQTDLKKQITIEKIDINDTTKSTEVVALFWVVMGYKADFLKLINSKIDKYMGYIINTRVIFLEDLQYMSVLDVACYCKRAPMVETLIQLLKQYSTAEVILEYDPQSINYVIEGDKSYYGLSDLRKKGWTRTPFGKRNMDINISISSGLVGSAIALTCNQFMMIAYCFGVGEVLACYIWLFVGGGAVASLALGAMWNVLRFGANKLFTISKIAATKLTYHLWKRRFAKPRAFIVATLIQTVIDIPNNTQTAKTMATTIFDHASVQTSCGEKRKIPN